MNYLALLYDDQSTSPAPGTDEFDALLARYLAFERLAGDGEVGGAALARSDALTVCGGEAPMISDGPFIEATEVIGGFYVLDAPDLDAAVELASHIPDASSGAVEIRPMVEWYQRPPDATPHGADGEPLPRYVALLYAREDEAAVPGTEAWNAGAEQHRRFGETVGEIVRAGGALHPSETATTLRVRDGERLLSDGPFLETAEMIGGLYVITAADRDDAARIASLIPLGDGVAELFPTMVFD